MIRLVDTVGFAYAVAVEVPDVNAACAAMQGTFELRLSSTNENFNNVGFAPIPAGIVPAYWKP